ncbi:MAG: SDR family oxidoreductase [Deltaproteobacteria bacterium]|nr:SDR family oxidoreductase [Deltaproteobacteria bacterium]
MTLKQFSLAGKVAIVTGSSTGLGKGMACGLAEAGADIAGVYHSNDSQKTQEIIENMGRRFHGIRADLSHLSSITDIIDQTIKKFGRLDILVNNAGIIRRSSSIDFTEKDWDDVMNVNLKSLFFLSQAAARQFLIQGHGGKIVNTASKSGVMGLTRLLACEWAPHNINVNAIAPGYMVTRNTQAIQDDPVRNKQILERIPAGRWGSPDDLQGAVVFLASDASRYIQGYTLAVDGGWLAR